MATPRSPAVLTLPEVVTAIPGLLNLDYEGVRNGRVRDLPDIRTIRWYQSLGILDRATAPAARRPCPLASATPQQADRGEPLAGQPW